MVEIDQGICRFLARRGGQYNPSKQPERSEAPRFAQDGGQTPSAPRSDAMSGAIVPGSLSAVGEPKNLVEAPALF